MPKIDPNLPEAQLVPDFWREHANKVAEEHGYLISNVIQSLTTHALSVSMMVSALREYGAPDDAIEATKQDVMESMKSITCILAAAFGDRREFTAEEKANGKKLYMQVLAPLANQLIDKVYEADGVPKCEDPECLCKTAPGLVH